MPGRKVLRSLSSGGATSGGCPHQPSMGGRGIPGLGWEAASVTLSSFPASKAILTQNSIKILILLAV